jgi:hypothetical protein
MGGEQKIAQGFSGYFGEADENPGIVLVVIGDEIRFRIASHQFFAAIERHLKDDLVAVIMQAEQQLSLHLDCGSAVRGALFRVWQGERKATDGVVGDGGFLDRNSL